MAAGSTRVAARMTVGGTVSSVTATASAVSTPAGQAVTITIATDNGADLAQPDGGIILEVVDENGGVIATWNVGTTWAAANGATRTFYFTAGGASGAEARSGTVEMNVRITRTSAVAYNWSSDGRGTQTVPAGSTAERDRGWLKGTTTAVVAVSNVAAGGAKPVRFAYPDMIHHRVSLGARSFVSRPLTLRVVRVAGEVVALSSSISSTGPNWDAALGTVNNQNFTQTGAHRFDFTIPNSAVSGQPWLELTSTTFDTGDIDPRLTFTQHLQESVNTFSTPPSTLHEASNQMLSTVLGFIAARVTNARGEGVNQAGGASLGISYSFRDISNLVATTTVTDQATAAGGGEAGWGPLMPWTASKPGGIWRNVVTFRDAAGVQGTANHDYVMLAADPRIAPAVGGGSMGSQDDHFVPGDMLVIAMSLFFGKTKAKIAPDAGTAEMAITRLNLATGTAQHLDSDGVWKNMGDGPAYFWPLLVSPTDSGVFRRVFGPGGPVHTVLDTSAWETYDLIIIGQAKVGGTPYARMGMILVTGTKNKHSKYEFDLVGMK